MMFEQWKQNVVFYVIMHSTCEYFTEDRSFYYGKMPFLKFTMKSSETSFVHFNKTVLACTLMYVHSSYLM